VSSRDGFSSAVASWWSCETVLHDGCSGLLLDGQHAPCWPGGLCGSARSPGRRDQTGGGHRDVLPQPSMQQHRVQAVGGEDARGRGGDIGVTGISGSGYRGHHLADPGAGMTQPLVPEHVLDHTAKHHIVTANAPSVLIAQVSDKLRSAPVTLLDQGDGAAPLGSRHPAPGSYEPQKIVGALPGSKWATPAQARVHRTVARHPWGHRPTSSWLAGRGVSVTRSPPWR